MDEPNREIDYSASVTEWMHAQKIPVTENQQAAIESIPSFLNRKMGQRNLSTAQLFEAARSERSTGYKIMNGQLLPGRNSLLRVAFVLNLRVEEVQYLLRIGKRACLSVSNRRDAIILHCLINRLSLCETDVLLLQSEEAPL